MDARGSLIHQVKLAIQSEARLAPARHGLWKKGFEVQPDSSLFGAFSNWVKTTTLNVHSGDPGQSPSSATNSLVMSTNPVTHFASLHLCFLACTEVVSDNS